ncbi:hypothetical protein PENTCL1PPCAC_12829, partial [Pristionchus entomophagus]
PLVVLGCEGGRGRTQVHYQSGSAVDGLVRPVQSGLGGRVVIGVGRGRRSCLDHSLVVVVGGGESGQRSHDDEQWEGHL